MMLAGLPSLEALLLWIALGVALALSAIYSATETAIYVTNKIRLDLQAEHGSRRAKLLRRMLQDPNNVLATLLVGNNIVNYAATFIISAMFYRAGYLHHVEWYTLAVATPIMFIFCESVPKNISQRIGQRLALSLSYVLWVSSVIYNVLGVALAVRLLAQLLMRFTKGRGAPSALGHVGLAAIVAEGQASGVLTHSQSVMADRIMRLRTVRLANVMISLSRAAVIRVDADADKMIAILRTHNFSRLPVVNAAGQVVGILDIYDVLLQRAAPAEKMTSPLVLTQDMRVTEALYQMQKSRAMMAVVQNQAGKHVGIVTIKDLVEEIVGELEAW